MLGSRVIGYTHHRLERVWSSRLSVPLRPASSGPLRHWQDQVRLAVKGAIAAVGAWALARYAIGQPDPYFAPLAALLGVCPTVARSLREGVQYVAGFLLGAALAILVGSFARPSMRSGNGATSSPVPWRTSARSPPTRTLACGPGHGTTASSPRRQSRPAAQPGTHGRACGGTCGPRLNEPYRGPTARCWIPLRS